MASHNDLGKRGEDEAVQYLLSCGYDILNRNYRFERAEIDIIARTTGLVVFIEVKTRSNDSSGYPEDFLTTAQQRRILHAADEYMLSNNIQENIRFDIIAITKFKGLEHIKDAFYHIDD